MNAGKILKLAAQSYVDSHPEALRDDLIKNLNVLLSAADDFNDGLASAAADKTLSPDGRKVASSRVASAALATLHAVRTTTIAKLEERATALEKTLRAKVAHTAPTNASERVAHEAQLREIRDQLRGLSASERLNTYRASTDPLVLAAIETAPPTLSAPRADGTRRLEPFVETDVVAEAVMARAAALDPQGAQTLAETRSLAQVYTLAVSSVQREILAEAAPTSTTA